MSIYTVHHFFVLGFTLLPLFPIVIIVTAIVIVLLCYYCLLLLLLCFVLFQLLNCFYLSLLPFCDSPPHPTEDVWRVSDQLRSYQLGLITTPMTLAL